MCVRLFSKPTISNKKLKADLEKYGPETVRTILLHGWANRQDYSEAIQQIAVPGSAERQAAIAWLEWKDTVQAFWIKSGIIAAVLAAIFSFFALVKSL
jgi:hypothetical protein